MKKLIKCFKEIKCKEIKFKKKKTYKYLKKIKFKKKLLILTNFFLKKNWLICNKIRKIKLNKKKNHKISYCKQLYLKSLNVILCKKLLKYLKEIKYKGTNHI